MTATEARDHERDAAEPRGRATSRCSTIVRRTCGTRSRPPGGIVSNTADGSIVSNVIDMSAYARMLLGRGRTLVGGHETTILSPAGFARFVEPRVLMDEPGAHRGERYGYGVWTSEEDGRAFVTHSGGMVGYTALLMVDVDDGDRGDRPSERRRRQEAGRAVRARRGARGAPRRTGRGDAAPARADGDRERSPRSRAPTWDDREIELVATDDGLAVARRRDRGRARTLARRRRRLPRAAPGARPVPAAGAPRRRGSGHRAGPRPGPLRPGRPRARGGDALARRLGRTGRPVPQQQPVGADHSDLRPRRRALVRSSPPDGVEERLTPLDDGSFAVGEPETPQRLTFLDEIEGVSTVVMFNGGRWYRALDA